MAFDNNFADVQLDRSGANDVGNMLANIQKLQGNTTLASSFISHEVLPPGITTAPAFTGLEVMIIGDTAYSSIQPGDLVDLTGYAELYVDIDRPNDSGDALTPANAKRSISAAIDLAIANAVDTVVYIKAGVYHRLRSVNVNGSDKDLTANIALVSVGGSVISGPFDQLSWSKTAGQTNVWQASRSSAISAVDPLIESNGSYRGYDLVASIAACDAQAGSWYTDNSIVYMHAHDSSEITNINSRVYINGGGAKIAGNFDTYISGIQFEGGSTGALRFSQGSTNMIVIDECSARYAAGGTVASPTSQNGVLVQGCGGFAAFNSHASYNSSDGFNFHAELAVKPPALLVNCVGEHNGTMFNTVQSCNGVTTHDGCSLIDVNGRYTWNIGTDFGHVHDGTFVVAYGTTAGKSDGDIFNGGGISRGGFGVWDADGVGESNTMYLFGCKQMGGRDGLYAGTGSTIYIRGHNGVSAKTGNVVDY